MRERIGEWLAGSCVPHTRGFVPGGRYHAQSVWAELSGSHPGAMPQRINQPLSRPRIPNDSRCTVSPFKRPVSVQFARPWSPGDTRCARRGGDYIAPIRTELGAVHPPVVPQRWRQFLPGHSIPNASSLISTGCDNPPAVGTKLSELRAFCAPVIGGNLSVL